MNVYAMTAQANSNTQANVTTEQMRGFPAMNEVRGVASFTITGQKSETSFSQLLQQQFAQLVNGSTLATLPNEENLTLDQKIEQLLISERWDEEDWAMLAQWLERVFTQQESVMLELQTGQRQENHLFERLASMIQTQWINRLEGLALQNDFANTNDTGVAPFVATVKKLIPLWQNGNFAVNQEENAHPVHRLFQSLIATLEEADVRQARATAEQATGTNNMQQTTNVVDGRTLTNSLPITNMANHTSVVGAALLRDAGLFSFNRLQANVPLPNNLIVSSETESVELKMLDVRMASVHTAMLSQHADMTNNQEELPNLQTQIANHQGENATNNPLMFRITDESKAMGLTPDTQPKANIPQSMQVNNFADDMARVLIRKWQTSPLNGISEARIQLVPEHLGHLDVHIKIQNGLLTAQFMADKLIGKEMIESQIAILRNALSNQGIQVDKIEVTHQPMHHGGAFQESSQHRSFKNQSSARKDLAVYALDEDVWLDDPEGSGEAVKRLAHGGVFDVTA